MSTLTRTLRLRPATATLRLVGARAMSASAARSSAEAGTEKVLYESIGGTRIYKLNRPKALNSLDQEMIDSLAEKTHAWRTSDLAKVIIGKGDERAFCAGGDVKGLVLSRPEHGGDLALKFFKDEFQVNWEMGRFGKPYVAIIDGFTMGGGAGISLPAGIRIATKKTVFAMPETKIGYTPDVGGNYYITQLDGEIGAWLAITGQEVWGRAVYELGIATHYVDPESLADLTSQLSQLEEPTLESISALVDTYHVAPIPEAEPSSKASREGPSPITGAIREFLDKTFSKESIQEIYAELKAAESNQIADLAPEVCAWAAVQRQQMDERSPTGMAVALANYKLAKQAKRLDTALENDILAATGFVGKDRVSTDFETGVTHLLIDKKKGRANWSPSDIDDPLLSPNSIKERFFNRDAKHATEVPTLEFNPKPTTKEGQDHTWGAFRRNGLPSEARVGELVRGETSGSGAFKLKEDELLQAVVDNVGGARQKEIEARVRDIVARKCKKDADGYLDWKN